MTLSREVLDRQRSAAAVASSITAHGAAAGESLASRFEGVLRKGERAPDVALALALFGRLLTRDAESLAAADDRHEAEKSDDDAPRAARDESATAVRDACVVARDGVAAVFGDDALAPLGLADPAPPVGDGPALARYADRAAAKLADPKLALPKPRGRGLSADRAALAAGIREQLPTLERSLADVERERRELEGTQAAKNRAMSAYDATFSLVANVTGAVLRAAGLDAQAERVRPSARRPGRTDAQPAEPENPADPAAPTG
jgi:hypothetical protein